MNTFTQVILYTDDNGRSQFREEPIALSEGTSTVQLSALQASDGFQVRQSPVGFASNFHCTDITQFVFILSGEMEISLQDGRSRTFKPGQHFLSADHLPKDAVFDPSVHGHRSRQIGSNPLITLFVRSSL
ncbi:MAG: hypothetical protein ACO3RT_08195 [Arenicellales bacterium]|jgi:hypothetical protein|nr:hypothetical protein [Gammaproteobacteria bacterium]NDA15060.1 hypothetical protein [Gammaproteobacteria bacterium]NDG44282.1 hypothetical protein [Gammaproteobacteria bacterium]